VNCRATPTCGLASRILYGIQGLTRIDQKYTGSMFVTKPWQIALKGRDPDQGPRPVGLMEGF
jgi:hypothetical protein